MNKTCKECFKKITSGSRSGLCKSCSHLGKRSYLWKGEEAGYSAKHYWIRKYYGNASTCSNDSTHKSRRFEWANISGKYLRDISDYKQLCKSCHSKMDTPRGINAKRIMQFTRDGEYIREFESAREAQRQIGVLYSAIANMLAGRSKKAGGFIWKKVI